MKCQEQVKIFHFIIIGINKSPVLMKRQRIRNSSTTGDKQQHSSNREIKYRPPLREYNPSKSPFCAHPHILSDWLL